MKRNNKKGFTLAELLIVVAIIAVLVAIAVPVFSSQLNKAKLATATANARGALAEYVVECLSSVPPTEPSLSGLTTKLGTLTTNETQGATITAAANTITVTLGTLSNTIPTDIGS